MCIENMYNDRIDIEIKIPSFVSGISLGGINKTPMGRQLDISRKIIGKFNELVLNGQNIPLKGQFNWLFDQTDVNKIVFKDVNAEHIESMQNTFMYQTVRQIDFSGLQTKDIKYMERTFQDCNNIEEINLLNLNLDDIVQLEGAFQFCNSLKTIKIPLTKNRKLKNIKQICYCDQRLEYISTESLKFNSAVRMGKAFELCKSLRQIDLRGLVVPKRELDISAEFMIHMNTGLEVLYLPGSIVKDRYTYLNIIESLKDSKRLRCVILGNILIDGCTHQDIINKLKELVGG